MSVVHSGRVVVGPLYKCRGLAVHDVLGASVVGGRNRSSYIGPNIGPHISLSCLSRIAKEACLRREVLEGYIRAECVCGVRR